MIKKLLLLFLIFFSSMPLWADWPLEERKIAYLLDQITSLQAVFIRNNTEHTPEEAANHLRMKFQSAQKSWFAPAKEKWTAEMFIEKIASKSSITGEPYRIKFKNGKTRPAGEWLDEKLGEWRLK